MWRSPVTVDRVVLVPPGTTELTATSASSRPALVALQAGNAGILVVGDLAAGKTGSTVSVARLRENTGTISTGFWFTDINLIGPVGSAGSPSGTARVTVQAKNPRLRHSREDVDRGRLGDRGRLTRELGTPGSGSNRAPRRPPPSSSPRPPRSGRR